MPTFVLWKVRQYFNVWHKAVAQHISFFFVLRKAVNTGLNVLFAQDQEGFLVVNYPPLE